MGQEVKKLLAIKAVAHADTGECPYASRPVVTPKKKTNIRMCVDSRDLNAQTEKDLFSHPRIDYVWPLILKARFYASLYLLMGYHQVEVEQKDRHKIGFLTHRGLFFYNVMPFGLCIALATVLRHMERMLGSMSGTNVLVYLDDVLVYAITPEKLLESLQRVLLLLAGAELKCKPSKCALFTQKVHYLGHVVSNHGINLEPD